MKSLRSATVTSKVRRVLAALIAPALLATAVAPPSAPAAAFHTPTAFSPITGAGIGTSLHLSRGIAVDETTGNVFVTSGQSDNVIDIMNSEGGVPVGVASPYTITGFDFGSDFPNLAVDNSPTSPSKGTLYVEDGRSVKKYVLNVGTEHYEEAGELTATPPLALPDGLAVDEDGNVYVSQLGVQTPFGAIIKFSPDGAELSRIESSALDQHGQSNGQHALAVDSAGDLFEVVHFKAFKYPANGLGEIEESNVVEIPVSGQAGGVAVDQASNTLYVLFGNHITEFDATTLREKGDFSIGAESAGGRGAINSAGGVIYNTSESQASTSEIQARALDGPTLADTGATAPSPLMATTATLHGVVNPQGIAVDQCKFEVFESPTVVLPCEGSIPTDSSNHAVSAQLSGLSPNTGYGYRLVVTNANGTNQSSFKFLTTEGIVKTIPASALTPAGATLNGVVRPEGSPLSECKFEYGLGPETEPPLPPDDEYEGSLPCSPAAGAIPADFEAHSVSADLSGLLVGSTYHFRIVASGGLGLEKGKGFNFLTLGPTVKSVSSSGATETAAVLEAVVNPRGQATAYHFEYGSQGPCSSNPCASMPAADVSIGAGNSDVAVSQPIKGLAPGTTYHFRIVVSNSDGAGHSDEATFTTYTPPPFFDSCGNDAFRLGQPSAKLPDCRAYEQATPIDKNGNDAGGQRFQVQASLSGDGVTTITKGGMPGGEGAQQYPIFLSQRGSSGWATQGLQPPPSFGDKAEVIGWTPDLAYSFSAATAVTGDVSGGFDTAFLVRSSATHAIQQVTPYLDRAAYAFAGASADDSKLFFEARGKGVNLTGDAATGKDNLYLYEPATEALSLVGVLPGGSTPPEGSFAGPFNWWRANLSNGGALGALSQYEGSIGYYTRDTHAISDDGSKAFFTAGGTGQIYVREGLGGESPETVHVSASQRAVPDPDGAKPATFLAASADGSVVFFMSCQKLTDDSTAKSTAANECDTEEQSQDLYAYDTESHQLSDLTVDSGDANGAEVKGFIGASDDGAYLYFVANGDLDGPEGPAQAGNCRRRERLPGVLDESVFYIGQCALYAWHADSTTFVTKLWPGIPNPATPETSTGSTGDAADWLPGGEASGGAQAPRAASVSANGQAVVFLSRGPQTAYSNVGKKCPYEACAELYRYHFGDPGPTCVTCNPTGATPTREPTLQSIEPGLSALGRPFFTRFLSASGEQVFFETAEKLVAGDVNGDGGCPSVSRPLAGIPQCQDVYEWEAPGAGSCVESSSAFSSQDGGCLYLLSTGASPDPSFLGDASVSGDSVFIFTGDRLVPGDQDGLFDAYAVRVDGGLASQNQPPPPPPCEAEACRGASSGAPTVPSAGTAGFSGPVTPPIKRCPKGKARKGGRCVKPGKRHPKHQRRQAGKRASGGRGGQR
jgi:hypothetical protein